MKVTKRNRESIIAVICFIAAGSIFQINEIIRITHANRAESYNQRAAVVDITNPRGFIRGETSATIKSVQEALTALGFYQGSVSGTFDNLTERAVRTYQRSHNLSVSGKLDPKTIDSILTSRE